MDRRIYGDPRRSPRDEKLSTPSGLEGSSGSSGFGCRGVAGWVATHILFPPGEVSERSKEHAWKVCIRQRIEGSNPSLSAIHFSKRLIKLGKFSTYLLGLTAGLTG